ncbi:MAG: hypothetical protein ABR567_21700 [Myxococcales bacterium]|nr:hypothetical protein [Myxococcales bacterium]
MMIDYGDTHDVDLDQPAALFVSASRLNALVISRSRPRSPEGTPPSMSRGDDLAERRHRVGALIDLRDLACRFSVTMDRWADVFWR